MKTLIIDGRPRGADDTPLEVVLSQDLAAGPLCKIVYLKDLVLKLCTGCQSCRLVTPGFCVHKDGVAALINQYLWAETLMVVTPVVFGGVGSLLKKLLDRFQPLEVLKYETRDGRSHMQLRHGPGPRLIIHGIQETNDEEEVMVFQEVGKRIGWDLGSPSVIVKRVLPQGAGGRNFPGGQRKC